MKVWQFNSLTCNQLAAKLTDANSAIVKGYAGYLYALQQSGGDPNKKGCQLPGATVDENGNACTQAADSGTSCIIDGVGWIVCTMANFLAKTTDAVYGLIEKMLQLPPLNTNVSDGENGVYNAWGIMRSFANVVFVILFLVIIFSQLTNAGVSNYGVKKLLPKLAIAAVLVNVSYWVGAAAVDVSNIAGQGVYDLLSGVKDRTGIGGLSANWGNVIGGLLAGGMLAVQAGAVVTGAAAATVFAAFATGRRVSWRSRSWCCRSCSPRFWPCWSWPSCSLPVRRWW